MNDATGLVAYRVAAAVAAGTALFSPLVAGAQFVVGAVGGLLVGVLIGWLAVQALRALDDPPVEVVVSLLVPFLAYVAAEEGPHLVWHDLIGFPGEPFFSGVLAAVAAGIFVSRKIPLVISSASSLAVDAVWNVLTFLLNGLAFILIGLQLPEITDGLGGYAVAELAGSAALVSLVVVLVRFAWVFPASYLPHLLYRGPRAQDPYPSWRNVLVVSWAGMRGVISLAAALALP